MARRHPSHLPLRIESVMRVQSRPAIVTGMGNMENTSHGPRASDRQQSFTYPKHTRNVLINQ